MITRCISFACALAVATSAAPLAAQNLPAADCVITPHRVTELSSPVMGLIEEVLVDKSDRVSRGQVVARLESSVEKAAVDLARVRATLDSEIEEGKINREFDSKRKQRMDSLYKQKNISEDMLDEFLREEKIAQVRLRQAEDLKKVRQYELVGMEARLAQKIIRAPFDGYVLERMKNPGEFVEEQAILRIAQLDPLNVEAIFPIELFGQIKIGMTAKIVMEAFPSKMQTAKVVLIDTVGNAASGTFGVRLEMPNPDNAIPAGLKCQAQIQ
ncbi:efflux RND transporter periplasmic adaptor subunit [Saccharophagus sp. K07]|uniref:efflux RND transporter periplasmic adaptor subunit n=1 Tax=Saccharophagus sp. K07 TaxID=2283636 RepID=UPI001651C391|nr:efflux RND transporter periplasmic adaptor subunit [Saccharophagus sp. K07]MBC6906504.1 efflux RND transporter periplasmic adaptor subunit [Saccharophagus sp. K07]